MVLHDILRDELAKQVNALTRETDTAELFRRQGRVAALQGLTSILTTPPLKIDAQ